MDSLATADYLANTIVTTADTFYGFFYDSVEVCASPILTIDLTITTSVDAGVDGNAVDFFNGAVSFAEWAQSEFIENCIEQ